MFMSLPYRRLGRKTSWQLHETWPYFIRLKGYFSFVIGGNPLEDEKRFILTNASFFATCKACQLPKNSIQQTILCTIELIEKHPEPHVFLINQKDELAKEANDEEAAFFRRHIVKE